MEKLITHILDQKTEIEGELSGVELRKLHLQIQLKALSSMLKIAEKVNLPPVEVSNADTPTPREKGRVVAEKLKTVLAAFGEQTSFTFEDVRTSLAATGVKTPIGNVRSRINYYANNGYLARIARGQYCLTDLAKAAFA